MELEKTFIARDGARLAYRLRRPGAPRRTLVLIHGLASNLTRWSEFVATTRLASDWDILRPDLRGHGGSVWRGRVGVDVWSDDIAALLASEGVPRAVLAGHCLGASVALGFARRFPHAVDGLVLIEPMFRDALKGMLARVARWRAALVPAVAALTALAALGVHRRRLAPLDLEQLDREARAATARAGSGFPEERYSSPWEDLKSFPASIYLQDLLAVTGPLPDLAAVRAPALALLSSGAAFTNLALTARRLAELPRCETVVLDARHWIPTEQPEAMRSAIDAWCLALETPPA
jgi:pimeloyl-ACP methyl ester carboxylesterase